MKKSLILATLLALNLNAFDLNSVVNTAKSISQTANTGDYKDLVIKALNTSVSELSKNGFLNTAAAKIELPTSLQMATNLAKQVGGDKWANELVTSINASATKAVGSASQVFLDTIKNMSQDDVKKIFLSGDGGFTKFLQTNSSDKLTKVFKPIIEEMMGKNSFATAYNGLNSLIKDNSLLKGETANSLKGLASNLGVGDYIPNTNEDLNDYITRKTLDGLFNVMKEKESSLSVGIVGDSAKLLQNIIK